MLVNNAGITRDTLAMREPDQLAVHSERLEQLRKDYEDRKTFWAASNLSPELKLALVSKSDIEVQKFWKLVSDQLLPALKRKDLNRRSRGRRPAILSTRGLTTPCLVALKLCTTPCT